MREALSQVPQQEHTEIGGQFSTAPGKTVHPISFNDLARFAFPEKTDKHLSFHTGYDERTCRRWRASNGSGAPAEALGVIMAEIYRRFALAAQSAR